MAGKILIIDDDRDITQIIRILLEGEGFETCTAYSGAQALASLDETVELIILDIMMDGMNGFEACHRIRESSYVPILFLSAMSGDSEKVAALMAGGDDYLCKPFSAAELTARVRSLLRRYRVYQGADRAEPERERLVLGMDNEVADVITGEEADSVFYGVVQTATRSLVEDNGADVLQKISVMCTDGIIRTVNIDKSLNYPTGWLVEISVTPEGEQVTAIESKSVSGTINDTATALGDYTLADDVQILDTTSEGLAGTVRPSRIAGTKLNARTVRYYTLNEQGQIDRLILNDVTGDLWKYGVLDDVKNLAVNAGSILGTLTGSGSSGSGNGSSGNSSSGSGSGSKGDSSSGSGSTGGTTNTTTVVDDLRSVLVPTTSEILWGVIDGSLLSTVWNRITSSSGSLLSIGLKQLAKITGQPMSTILNFVGGGATYICYVNGSQASFSTSIKYPVLAGGLAVRQNVNGTVKAMIQLMPMKIDKVGAASVMSNGTRYETADDMQVYLWYKGQYYATKLSEVNSEGYYLTGWYDNFGCAAGKRVRVIVAVKKD